MMKKPRKSIKDIVAGNPREDLSSIAPRDIEGHYGEKMLCDAKKLVDRMKDAYRRKKRMQKIQKLLDRSGGKDELWGGLS